METAKQVSVFLENKPGRLANVLTALAREKVNVTALTIMDSHEHSVLRLVTDDIALTLGTLRTLNVTFTEADVLKVELKNNPGALAHVCEQMAAEHVNIDYAYASSGGRNGKVYGIFKVSNLDKAKLILGKASNNVHRPETRLPRKTIRKQTAPAAKAVK